VYCAHEQHIPDRTTEMCSGHRNRTLSRQYIGNVYCAQNAFQTVYRKCLLCTETTLSRRFIRNAVYRTHSRRYIRNVYCAQNTFETVHQKCVLCTETKHFPDGSSEMLTVHRTHSRRYIRNVYCAQKQNFQDGTSVVSSVHCNRTFSDGTSEVYTVHKNKTHSRQYT
jgi:hypothetical protein